MFELAVFEMQLNDYNKEKVFLYEEQKAIHLLKSDLIAQETVELDLMKKNQELNVQLAGMIFEQELDDFVFARTSLALNFVRNTLYKIREALSDMRLSFTDYEGRLEKQELDIQLNIDQLQGYQNDPATKLLLKENGLQGFKKSITDEWFKNVKNVYEGALGWTILGKLSHVASVELNNLPGYSMFTDLQSLYDIYMKVANQQGELIDGLIEDKRSDMIEEQKLANKLNIKTSLDFYRDYVNK